MIPCGRRTLYDLLLPEASHETLNRKVVAFSKKIFYFLFRTRDHFMIVSLAWSVPKKWIVKCAPASDFHFMIATLPREIVVDFLIYREASRERALRQLHLR